MVAVQLRKRRAVGSQNNRPRHRVDSKPVPEFGVVFTGRLEADKWTSGLDNCQIAGKAAASRRLSLAMPPGVFRSLPEVFRLPALALLTVRHAQTMQTWRRPPTASFLAQAAVAEALRTLMLDKQDRGDRDLGRPLSLQCVASPRPKPQRSRRPHAECVFPRSKPLPWTWSALFGPQATGAM